MASRHGSVNSQVLTLPGLKAIPAHPFFFFLITLKPRVEGCTKSTSLKYEPASEPLHIPVKKLYTTPRVSVNRRGREAIYPHTVFHRQARVAHIGSLPGVSARPELETSAI